MSGVHSEEKPVYTHEKGNHKSGSDYEVNHAVDPVGEEYVVERKLKRQLKNRHIAMIRYAGTPGAPLVCSLFWLVLVVSLALGFSSVPRTR
jgi:amino acid permease